MIGGWMPHPLSAVVPASARTHSQRPLEYGSPLSRGRQLRHVATDFAFALLALLAAVIPSHAQDYPTRPITLVVPYAAGGGNDLLARIAAEKMSRTLDQQIVI